jgi:hypothetical protein
MTTEWYQQGLWPLLGAGIALAIPNALAIINVNRQHRKSLEVQIKLKNIDFVNQQLTDFYNPLYSLMMINGSVFESTGPISFPEDIINREVAALAWNKIKLDVIIPNNQRIMSILRDKSHLISKSDSLLNYMELQNHLAMYEVFQNVRTESYEKFKFPSKILEHIKLVRSNLIKEFSFLKK